MIVAKYIAEYLRDYGITHVFGYDGSMMLKIADEISLTDGIEYYQGFQEQGCAFMADSYARVSGKIGVVLVTSGPGAINVLAGCADAYMDSVPLLIITGNDRLSHIKGNPGVRLNGFQDLDIVSMAKSITKYTIQITDAGMVAYELEKAIQVALDGRKGPVLIDVPMDVQFWEMPDKLEHYKTKELCEESKNTLLTYIQSISFALSKAKYPVVLAGGGIHLGHMEKEFADFIEIANIPVIETLNGHDSSSSAIGVSGLYGHPEANLAIYHADVLIAIGVRFGQQQVGKLKEDYTNAKIFHIDIDEKELGRVFPNEIGIHADGKKFIPLLCEYLKKEKLPDYSNWYRQINKWREVYQTDLHVSRNGIDPLDFVRYIGEYCPKGTIYTNDVGQNTMWVCQGLPVNRRHRLLTSSGYASMGFSIPAAIGAKMASPENMVISFSGDGGFHMNIQELQFVKMHKLNVKFAVFNNNTLGMMREVQRIYYNHNYIGSDTVSFTCADLKKVADLYDLDYISVASEKEFKKLDMVLNSNKAAIIDCRLPIDTFLRNWNDFRNEHPEALEHDYE